MLETFTWHKQQSISIKGSCSERLFCHYAQSNICICLEMLQLNFSSELDWLAVADNLTAETQTRKYVPAGINTCICIQTQHPQQVITQSIWWSNLVVLCLRCPPPWPCTPLGKRPFASSQYKQGSSCKGSGTHKEIKICLEIMKQSFVQKVSKCSKGSSTQKYCPPSPPASRKAG